MHFRGIDLDSNEQSFTFDSFSMCFAEDSMSNGVAVVPTPPVDLSRMPYFAFMVL